VDEPTTNRFVNEPIDVRDEAVTFEARVVPMSEAAGKVPVCAPNKLPVPLVKNKFVVEAVVAKKLVEVEFVVVEFNAVKFWRVEEPRDSKLPNEPVPVTVNDPSVPTLVRDDAVTPAARVFPVNEPAGAEPVMFPVRLPVAEVKKRFVVEAVVAKKLVEVLLVVVALRPV
jgi:hypothetical protein